MTLIFLDGNTAASTIPGFEGQILFPEVMDKHAYKAYRAHIRARAEEQGDGDNEDDIARVYVTLINPETGQEEEVPLVFSFGVADVAFKLARFEGFPPAVQKLLGPHNPDGNGLPLTLMALISRAAGEWVARQLSFRLDSRPEPADAA